MPGIWPPGTSRNQDDHRSHRRGDMRRGVHDPPHPGQRQLGCFTVISPLGGLAAFRMGRLQAIPPVRAVIAVQGGPRSQGRSRSPFGLVVSVIARPSFGPPRGRRSCPHRWCRAASSSEPPTSVGLACHRVGAWRRHLVKRLQFIRGHRRPIYDSSFARRFTFQNR